MVGDKALNSPLTENERALIERYHNIIYRVIRNNRLTQYIDDIYGDAVLALMVAARKYLNNPHLQNYSFITIAYKSINKVCRKYLSEELIPSRKRISIDDEDLKLYNKLVAPEDAEVDNEQAHIQCSFIMGLLTEKEQEAIQRHADGLTCTQVKKIYGVNPRTHRSAVERAMVKCWGHYSEIFGTDEVVEMPRQKSKRRILEEEGALIKKLYHEGMKVYPISRKLGRQATVIKAYLIREGVIDG